MTSEDKRVLGDEWQDWDGDLSSHQIEISETAIPFSIFSGIVLTIYLAGAALLCWLVLPRLDSLHPNLARLAIGSTILVILGSWVWFIFILAGAASGRSVLPGRLTRGFVLRFLNPVLIKLSSFFGYSRDRIGHSYMKLNNALVRASGGSFEKTVVLLPRCLSSNTKEKIAEICGRYGVDSFTVGGGEQARRVVEKERPDSLVAVACERDLAAGIRDVDFRIAVLGIPNARPDGPCRNTVIDLHEFEKAVEFFRGNKKEEEK